MYIQIPQYKFMHKYLLPILALFTLFSCAPARFVKPLADGGHAVNVAVGGPLFEFGNLVIPMPLLSAAYGYGVDSTLTAFGGVNIT